MVKVDDISTELTDVCQRKERGERRLMDPGTESLMDPEARGIVNVPFVHPFRGWLGGVGDGMGIGLMEEEWRKDSYTVDEKHLRYLTVLFHEVRHVSSI